MTDFRLQGVDHVLRKLRTLGPKLQKRALAGALRKGAAIVRKAAVRRAKQFDRADSPNKVYREIVTRTNARAGKKAGGAVVQIGVKGGAKRYVNNSPNRRAGGVGKSYEGPGNVYYWRFLEFGTAKMPAQPFMRPALEQNVGAVTEAIVSDLNKRLDELVKEP